VWEGACTAERVLVYGQVESSRSLKLERVESGEVTAGGWLADIGRGQVNAKHTHVKRIHREWLGELDLS
jgi:hypothetical protein